jgi:outer membrane receptor for ferrienterochelin and colicin
LYGGEIGWGGGWESFKWDATLFFNQLHNAIANVTIGQVFCGPVPCGTLRQRQNAGNVNAFGFEGQLTETLTDNLNLSAAIAYTGAQFMSGQLDGLRPAQAPRSTITGGATWQPLSRLSLETQLHWEGMRFEDDRNTVRLGAAFVLDARTTYRLMEELAIYAAVDNVTDANVATAATTDATLGEIISYGQPRMFWLGATYTE